MNLSKRERLIGIGTATVIGLLALDSLFLSPLWARYDVAHRAVEEGQRELDRAQQLFQNKLRAQRRWNEITGTTLKNDASAAESQLLNRVRDYAQSANLVLGSLKPERIEKEKDFQRITIRASATGTMEQTSRFLYALRNADIPLRVSDVQINSRKDGVDDVAVQIGISTIFVPPPEPPTAGTSGARSTATPTEVRPCEGSNV